MSAMERAYCQDCQHFGKGQDCYHPSLFEEVIVGGNWIRPKHTEKRRKQRNTQVSTRTDIPRLLNIGNACGLYETKESIKLI